LTRHAFTLTPPINARQQLYRTNASASAGRFTASDQFVCFFPNHRRLRRLDLADVTVMTTLVMKVRRVGHHGRMSSQSGTEHIRVRYRVTHHSQLMTIKVAVSCLSLFSLPSSRTSVAGENAEPLPPNESMWWLTDMSTRFDILTATNTALCRS
jgi:hypothetical protein